MDKELFEAYRSTLYQVNDPLIQILIGQQCGPIDALLQQHNCSTYAFITAWNPFSNLLSDAENENRNQLLYNELIGKFLLFQGQGIGQDPKWKPEESFLVLGIDECTAIEVGKKFEQNAIVFGTYREQPRLLILIDQY
jgi:hypothetical protein